MRVVPSVLGLVPVATALRLRRRLLTPDEHSFECALRGGVIGNRWQQGLAQVEGEKLTWFSYATARRFLLRLQDEGLVRRPGWREWWWVHPAVRVYRVVDEDGQCYELGVHPRDRNRLPPP